ncbi:hypothetical protein [Glaciecola petra]|uniref:Uncharacterized protein n=1 Tax=Glaciecola petra TaxID=3075602 RepID=A0ABU2ZPI3_9ALTE|nr:hypothetical protein [Aestuariibacter sp. P117]MDT0594540.1 hypothetical protein [Aestuariibacter sp. P117]
MMDLKVFKDALDQTRKRAIKNLLALQELKPLKLMLSSEKLKEIERDLSILTIDFVEAVDAFYDDVKVSGMYGTDTLSPVLTRIDSIRLGTSLIVDNCNQDASSLRTNVYFYRTMAISIIALIVSLVALAA